jgi:excisionase family DNA binding protein
MSMARVKEVERAKTPKAPRLNVKEAAAYIPVAKSTLDKLRVAGGGPRYIRIGAKILYDVSDLDAWMENHKQANTADIPRPARVDGRRRHR